jgi:hypothetical protein
MGFKPIPTKKFKKYLKSKGLKHLRDKGDHEIWDNPDEPLIRPVTFIGCDKEIPSLHIKTNLETLGISYDEFEKEI